MVDTSPHKKHRYKLCIDPLPFLEYFVQNDEMSIEIAKVLLKIGEMKEALDHHTVNPEYAYGIAKKFGYPGYVPKHTLIDLNEVKSLLSQPMSETCVKYLEDRKFPLELIPHYEMSSWKFTEDNPYKSMAYYYPFNKEELDYSTYKLQKLGEDTDMSVQDMLVMPSYGRSGDLNNLVFRYVDEYVSRYWCKWLFSHGRQATFGLHKIDPSKPVYVVEGFFDYVAMDQMGMQSVGLGSAFISDKHWEFLKDLDLLFILDSDEAGRNHSKKLEDAGHTVLRLRGLYKDPYEYWINKTELQFT
jgi:DNA primase